MNELTIHISGSGDIDTENLQAEKVNIIISGSGDCRVHVIDQLVAKTSGSGDIYYKGTPKMLDSRASGSGSIKTINE